MNRRLSEPPWQQLRRQVIFVGMVSARAVGDESELRGSKVGPAPTQSVLLGAACASGDVVALRAVRDAGEGLALCLRAVYALRRLRRWGWHG